MLQLHTVVPYSNDRQYYVSLYRLCPTYLHILMLSLCLFASSNDVVVIG